MSSLQETFSAEAKVVISPDLLRAWVMLPPPQKKHPYTVENITRWLEQNQVVYGVDAGRIQEALDNIKYHELMEVARGDAPVNGTRGGYTLRVEKIAFTGLKGGSDGSLYYDDLSFLQEAEAGQILAEAIPPDPGRPGRAVTGEPMPQKPPEEAKTLTGSGFEITDGGRYYRAPVPSHVNVVNNQLVVVPLLRLESLEAGDGPVDFNGNVLLEKDLHTGAEIRASGSVFVMGRAEGAVVRARRNVLLANGMRSAGGYGTVEAGENVWGLCFESVIITAGGDLSSNHLLGCEVRVEGRAHILGGRSTIAGTTLYAKGGAVAARIGDTAHGSTLVAVGMDAGLIARMENIERRIGKLNIDINSTQQNITAFERLNRTKPGKGREDPTYKEMCAKRGNALSALGILNAERTRLKRTMDAFSAVAVIAREVAYPGVKILIDTREYDVKMELHRVKFRREGDAVLFVTLPGR